jgi:copper transport protein
MFAALTARIALVLALFLSCAGTARAHAVVVETEPADGAVLSVAPDRIRIVFSEPVSLIAAQVLDAGGRNVIAPNLVAVRDGAVEIALPSPMEHGTYLASYRVVSLDGHPVGGSIVFSIGEPSRSPQLGGSSDDRAWRIAWTAVRAALNAGLLGSAGGVLFLLFVARTGGVATSTALIVSRLAILGLFAATLSVGVQGGLLIGGSIEGIASPAIWQTGLASTFGRSALVAFAGLALILAGMRWPSPAGRMVALGGALVAMISYAFAGHVVTAGPRWLTVPAFIAHTSAVAFWIGSLLPLRAALSHDQAALLVRRFSSIAVAAVAILIVAGIVIAVLQVRSFAALVTTTYGWILVGKLALVAGLLSLAALNKWRLTTALARRDPRAAIALRRTINAELAIVAAILIATAALGTTPPPRALLNEHTHTPEHHSADQHHAHGLSVEMSDAGRRVTLTFASAHAGANNVEVAIGDAGGKAVEAKEVTVTAANPAAGVEPIRRSAVSIRPGAWAINGLTLVPAGKWSIGVEVLVSDFEKPIFQGTVDLIDRE